MQIFLSYSHEDAEFARYLSAALRAAGVDIWLDEERMRGGERNFQRIVAATRQSQHAIFLVSHSWLDKDWTLKELSLFETRDPAACRRIAVLMMRRADIRDALPPAIAHVSNIEWLQDDATPDARLWEVYCAVHGLEPGPRPDWVSKGRSLQDASTVRVFPPLALPPACEMPSLFCNREKQWSAVDPLSTRREHCIVFLPGRRGEAHDSFSSRIELRLQVPMIRRVTWSRRHTSEAGGRPSGEAEFREAIAGALDVHVSAVVPQLKAVLATRHLILLHERICDDYDDPELIRYYTVYLPRLVDEAAPQMTLKCVQGLEWLERPLLSRLLRFVTARPSSDDKRRAMGLIEAVRVHVQPPFAVEELPELESITDAHIRTLCGRYRLTDAEMARLLDRVHAGSGTSEDKLETIDDFLRERRRPPRLQKEPHGRPLHLASLPR